MRFLSLVSAFFVIGCLAFEGFSAMAGTFDAREVARLNNCSPKKIEVARQSLGATGRTVYKVECLLSAKGDDKKGPDAVLVACDGNLCELLRPVRADEK
jgi:hypothetical protein